MRVHGTLAKWNEDRGFGFITPGQGGHDLFVHISAFPRDGGRPQIGELISFEIETAPDGKKRAVRVMRPASQSRPPRVRREPPNKRSGSWISSLLGMAAVVAIAAVGYSQYTARKAVYDGQRAAAHAAVAPAPLSSQTGQPFKCDGREHCRQMRSCEEATFFIRHCPNTKMDGNNDGVPCEQQLCR